VIRVPYQFERDPRPIEKLFVVLCHMEGCAICIKTTSKTDLFRNNPAMRKGCVWYSAGQLTCFPLDTVIEPDNQIPIPHDDIRRAQVRGTLEVYALPASFEEDLRSAIDRSATLSPRRRIRLLSMLDT
jgi:hypothetical protein